MKKLLALALSLSMILACMTGITLTASAATVSGVELAGEGTDASPYIIDSAAKFTAVFGNGTTADFTKVYLVTGFDQTELTLTGYTPEKTQVFKGKLLGGNYVNGAIVPVKQKINIGTINNEDKPTHASKNTYTGTIFHYVESATISDLALYGAWNINTNQAWNHYFGVLVGLANTNTNITRVDTHVDVTVSANGNYGYAGIVGNLATSTITDCDNYGDVKLTVTPASSRGMYVAGIAVQIYKKSVVQDCTNYGDIVGNIYTGGITGYANTDGATETIIKNCINMGNISPVASNATARSIGAIVGGIAAKAGTLTVADCFNMGTITSATNTGLVCGLNATTAALVISNFYDLANPSIASVIGSNGATLTVTNAYGYSKEESTTANDVSKVSYEAIAGLDEVFGSAWTKSGAYPYPMPASNIIAFGTADVPAPIFTALDLKNVSNSPASSYKLMADISGMDEMIGVETPFSGVFDGNGKTIELNIDTTAETEHPKYAGLFSQASGTIKNLNIAGKVEAGFVNYQGGTAGFVGKGLEGLKIDNCNNYADITSLGHHSAGIVGNNNAGAIEITNSINYGDIYGGEKAAGIVGVIASSSKIQQCGNYGNITGGTHAAGICEWTYTWQWLNSNFNVGTITATATNGIAAGLYADMVTTANGKNVQYNFNAGNLYGDNTYGIAQINDGSKKLTIKNSYNLVYADYPVFNKTESNPTAYADLFYISDSETDEVSETTAVSKDTLKAKTITGMAKSGNYSYPQPTANKLDTDKDSIDVSKVTLTNETENVNVTIDTYPVGSFYVANGGFVTVKADANDFYEVLVNGEKVEDKAVVTVNGDISVAVTENKIEYVVPDSLGNTVYAFTSDEKGTITLRDQEYSRYSLIFSKAAPANGLKRTEFGMFFGTDENISKDNYKEKAVAEEQRISEEGTYGVLFYSNNNTSGLVDGTTYYVLPYAVYVDVDGNEYVVTGTTQSFIFGE